MNKYEFISKNKIMINQEGLYNYNKSYDTEGQVVDPILLHEYMVFRNHNKHLKFILLEFKNISYELIHKFTFEVYEYNQDHNLIRKSSYLIEGVNIRKKTQFTFPNKISVLDACSTIETKVVFAESHNSIWNGYEWEQKESFVIEGKPILQEPVVGIPIEIKSFSEDTIRSTEIMKLHKNEFSFNWLKPIVLMVIFLAVLVIIYYVSFSLLMN